MAKGKKGRLRRIVSRCVRGLLVILALAFVIFWLWGPSLLRNWFIGAMAEEGIEATLTVDDLGFSETRISALQLEGQGVGLKVGEIHATYGLNLATQGKARKVQARDINLELDLDLLLTEEGKDEGGVSLEDLLREWSNLPFEEALVEEMKVKIIYDGNELSEISLGAWLAQTSSDGLSLEANSSLVPSEEVLAVHANSTDGNSTDGNSTDGNSTDGNSTDGNSTNLLGFHANLDLEENGAILSGKLRVADLAKVTNMSRTALGGQWPNWLITKGKLDLHASVQARDDEFTILDLNAEVKDLSGQLFSEDGNWSGYYANDISATLAMSGENGPLKIEILPCFVVLPGISLPEFSFTGELASWSNPVLSSRQTLRCKELQWVDGGKMPFRDLHDLNASFRFEDQWNTFLLDSMDFKLDENASEARCRILPQRAAFTRRGGGAVTLALNNTRIELPGVKLTIEDLNGSVQVNSFDPLEIPKSRLTFDKVTFRGLSWGPGEVLFSADRNGTFSLEKCEGEFLGETLGLKPLEIDLKVSSPEFDFTFVVTGENNQSLVEFSAQPIAVKEDDANKSSGQSSQWKIPLQGEVFDLTQVFGMVAEWNSTVLPKGLEVTRGSATLEGGYDSNITRVDVSHLKVPDLFFDLFGNSFHLQEFRAKNPIRVSSVTGVPNENILVEFKSAKMADISWGPGKLEIVFDENASRYPIRCEGVFLGGALELKYDHDLNDTDGVLEITAIFTKVDSEELAKLMPGLEIELRGLLSGRIKLSNRDGFWNYLDGGYLEMVSDKGYLSYPLDGLLTEGMDPKSSEFKRSRLVEQALQDLDLSKLRLDFRVDPQNKHFIKGDLHGSSQVESKRIRVTYRPRINAAFIELLQQLEFGGVSFE